jgi:hypothetical protein
MQFVRPSPVLVVMSALALVLVGYGYGEEQDPLIEGFKSVASHARAGDWGQAQEALPALEPALAEIRTVLDLDLAPPLREAIRTRSRQRLAEQLARLAYFAIRVKLESCRREELARYYAAKYRVEAARSYYQEMLAPSVRRDPGRGAPRDLEVHAAFAAARSALGRPGFLGRGVEPPDRAAFARAEQRLDAALRDAFPFLAEVNP